MATKPKPEMDRLIEHSYDGIQEYDNPMPRWWVLTFWGTIIFSVLYAFNVGGMKGAVARRRLQRRHDGVPRRTSGQHRSGESRTAARAREGRSRASPKAGRCSRRTVRPVTVRTVVASSARTSRTTRGSTVERSRKSMPPSRTACSPKACRPGARCSRRRRSMK